MADLAAMVGATSDNLATNVLIRHIGLEAVRARTETLGLTRTALLDLVRDHRGPDDAPQLSIGSAKELTWLFASLARGEIVSPEVSQRVVGWLSLNSDLSMVAAAFGLDPLAHRMPDHNLLLMNKTGTDGGVRSEVGVLRGPPCERGLRRLDVLRRHQARLTAGGARRHAPGRGRPARIRALTGRAPFAHLNWGLPRSAHGRIPEERSVSQVRGPTAPARTRW
jgi:hypothetical protein